MLLNCMDPQIHLQKTGAAVNWSIKKQPAAAISTSEAE